MQRTRFDSSSGSRPESWTRLFDSVRMASVTNAVSSFLCVFCVQPGPANLPTLYDGFAASPSVGRRRVEWQWSLIWSDRHRVRIILHSYNKARNDLQVRRLSRWAMRRCFSTLDANDAVRSSVDKTSKRNVQNSLLSTVGRHHRLRWKSHSPNTKSSETCPNGNGTQR